MTTDVVSVVPETPVLEAHRTLAEHRFDGVPVVDRSNRLVGILTEYDLIAKGSAIHIPTFQKILSEISVYKKDRGEFTATADEITRLTVRDVMNPEPLTLHQNAPLNEVVIAFRDHHRVNPIPVIDDERRVVGVVSRYDVLKLLSLFKP